ncbi:MAG: PqqD family protein [Armatimonadetes bacterium]|nr:PqqD family protein [Armatimonadota bacterium]
MDNINNKEITFSEKGFLFDHNSGLTFTLNKTASFIYSLLKQGKNKEEIVKEILDNFDIDVIVVKRDLEDFILQLKEFELC